MRGGHRRQWSPARTIYSFILSGFHCVAHSITLHSAALHVGLKSLAPSGHLHSYFFNCKAPISSVIIYLGAFM
ncbi:hypothetical protein Barb7_01710 [Bacteroidales bacterium Barb7]|nr:hypothetical protein Barb7_01710 [Bacteroidales bacterium Barb7]